MGELAERYLRAVHENGCTDLDLLPAVLSSACREVLPVDGAGLSITGPLRVPLGASGDEVRAAERLQSTLGEGPCLAAAAEGEPLAADQADIAARWPLFHREITVQTPYRSIVSLPIRAADDRPLGALDLYSRAPGADRSLLRDEVQREVVDEIARLLLVPLAIGAGQDGSGPAWLESTPVNRRMRVWAAVGMLMAVSRQDEADSLAALRGYAFSHDRSLDDLAEAVVAREIDVLELVA
jgi:hypothetical protein